MIRMAIQVVFTDDANDRRDVHEIVGIDRGPLEFIPICNLTRFGHTDPQTGGMTDGWSAVR
jgi:hypothetical protein